MYGTDHVIEPREIRAKEDTKNHGAEECANETLKSLFWRELDKRGAANGNTPNIGKDVVTYNEKCWDPKPDEAFENIIHDEVTDVPRVSTGHKQAE
jgi:hypothetical protein